MVQTCAKDYVKWAYCFLSGSESTSKSHLAKEISNAKSKSLLYHCKDPEKLKILSLGPTGISAVKTGGTTVNSGLRIKLDTKLYR